MRHVEGERRGAAGARRVRQAARRLRSAIVALAVLAAATEAAAGTYEIEPSGSSVLVVTRRAGLLGALGHDHAIEGDRLSGRVAYEPGAPPGERIRGEIVVDAAALDIDAPAARRAAGLGDGPSGDDLTEIRRTLHGPDVLDTGRFPTVRFVLTGLETAGREAAAPSGDEPETAGRVTGRLTLRGQTRPLVVPADVSRSGDRLVVRARVRLRQTDFGIRPASVAGGLVKVRDEVEVTVTMRLAESSAATR